MLDGLGDSREIRRRYEGLEEWKRE